MQKKLASLRERIAANAVVQQGDKPHEDPAKLLKEADGIAQDLEDLVFRINRNNLTAKTKDGRTLTQLLAHRDTLGQRHSLLQAAIGGARREPDRYSMKEIKWVAVLDVAKLQKQADDLSRQIRETNAAIQEANWNIEMED